MKIAIREWGIKEHGAQRSTLIKHVETNNPEAALKQCAQDYFAHDERPEDVLRELTLDAVNYEDREFGVIVAEIDLADPTNQLKATKCMTFSIREEFPENGWGCCVENVETDDPRWYLQQCAEKYVLEDERSNDILEGMSITATDEAGEVVAEIELTRYLINQLETPGGLEAMRTQYYNRQFVYPPSDWDYVATTHEDAVGVAAGFDNRWVNEEAHDMLDDSQRDCMMPIRREDAQEITIMQWDRANEQRRSPACHTAYLAGDPEEYLESYAVRMLYKSKRPLELVEMHLTAENEEGVIVAEKPIKEVISRMYPHLCPTLKNRVVSYRAFVSEDPERCVEPTASVVHHDRAYYEFPEHAEFDAGIAAMRLLKNQSRYFPLYDSLECVNGLGWEDPPIVVEALRQDGSVESTWLFTAFEFDRGRLEDGEPYPTFFLGEREIEERSSPDPNAPTRPHDPSGTQKFLGDHAKFIHVKTPPSSTGTRGIER